MRSSRYSTLLRVLLVLIATAGLSYWAATVRELVDLALHPDGYTREPINFDDDTHVITKVEPEAKQAGIVEGAVLETLNGVAYEGGAQWAAIINPAAPGDVVDIGFRRPDGSRATAHVHAAQRPRLSVNSYGWRSIFQQAFLFVLPLICMLMGYWVVLAKPDEPNAWLLLVLLCFPEAVFSRDGGWSTGGWYFFREYYRGLLQAFGVFALVPFAVYFPERSRIDLRVPWLKWCILLPGLTLGVAEIVQFIGRDNFAGTPGWLVAAMPWVDRIDNFFELVSVIFYIVVLTDKLRSASSADGRRRLRVLLVGTGIGVGALLLIFVLLPHFGVQPNTEHHSWLAYSGALLFMVAPFTLAYVVLVQRAMDVSILIRQGTRYALARAVFWAVQFLLVAFITWHLLLPLLSGKAVQPEDLWQVVLFLLLLFVLRVVLGKRGQNWLDRKFFREAYDSERVLSELSEEVRKYTESGPLLKIVAQRVAETLHVSQIGMMLRDGTKFCVSQAVGVSLGESGSLTLALNSSTIRHLSNTNAPALVYPQDPEAWYLMADDREREALTELGSELLLPLPGRDRLMGVMSLGAKQSEAAYSKSDLHLLQLLATQTGMALEVSELAHSLAHEARERERANREIEIAHEVQQRLFPQVMPALAAGSVAGACRPAQGVGGDYYDVFALQDGRLGIAIGDVSGKGISAALLMASLRASLRGVSLDNPRDFAKLMDKVNRLVYEASADNRYATFFFGALDPESLMLECVNAGHNAPLILRQTPESGAEILRLEADGPVVGLLPFAPYTEQCLQLRPGDLVVTYTDGISEAMTHDDEEWGEERMMEAASVAKDGSAEDVLVAVFAAADRFTAGAPQHDDMTMLILKLDPAVA